ncbi:MAG: hypothetical protein K0S61_743 [Anaerocolumna sp.]|nr:hypothetical protein [Anaerocolumna sp.]
MKNMWQPIEVQKISEKNNKVILEVVTDASKDEILRYATDKGLKGDLKFDDGRTITADQRKKIFAMVKDFSLYTGYEAEYARQLLTLSFCIDFDIEPFSLSNCSLEVAREFITWLIDFCIGQDIPLSQTALERTDDIGKYLYTTLKHNICCICGDKGITYSIKQEKICLCDKHHDVAKLKGLEEFERLFKVYPIKYIGG